VLMSMPGYDSYRPQQEETTSLRLTTSTQPTSIIVTSATQSPLLQQGTSFSVSLTPSTNVGSLSTDLPPTSPPLPLHSPLSYQLAPPMTPSQPCQPFSKVTPLGTQQPDYRTPSPNLYNTRSQHIETPKTLKSID